jgi:hypothetical protein
MIAPLLGDWDITFTSAAACTDKSPFGHFYWLTCEDGEVTIHTDWMPDAVHADRSFKVAGDFIAVDVTIWDDIDPTIFIRSETLTMSQVAVQGNIPVFQGHGTLHVGVSPLDCQEQFDVQALHTPLELPPPAAVGSTHDPQARLGRQAHE